MTASGPIVDAEELLALALADSATWRSWCGAADQAAALARIYHDALPRPTGNADSHDEDAWELELLPAIVLWTDEAQGFALEAIATSDAFDFSGQGRLAFYVWQQIPAAHYDDEAAADRDFKTKLGSLLADLAAVAGLPGYLAMERIELVRGPLRAHDNERFTQGRSQVALVSVQWGSER